MLRIAVPNKGTLSETAVEMLREAGYATRRDPKELIVADPRNDVEFFYLRPRDIATSRACASAIEIRRAFCCPVEPSAAGSWTRSGSLKAE